jgi:hypothetical protein
MYRNSLYLVIAALPGSPGMAGTPDTAGEESINALWLPERRAFIRCHDFPGEGPPPVLPHGLGSASSVDFHALVRSPAFMRRLFLDMPIPRSFIYGELSLPDPDMGGLQAGSVGIFIVPKAGHGMMDDNPEGFADALRCSFDR